MCPRAENRQPSCLAPDPSVVASITPSTPDLSQIPANELDRFIQDHLQPNPQFLNQVKKAIDSILSHLRKNCVYKASRVSKVSWAGGDTDGTPLVDLGGEGRGHSGAAEDRQGKWTSLEGSLLTGGIYLSTSFRKKTRVVVFFFFNHCYHNQITSDHFTSQRNLLHGFTEHSGLKARRIQPWSLSGLHLLCASLLAASGTRQAHVPTVNALPVMSFPFRWLASSPPLSLCSKCPSQEA